MEQLALFSQDQKIKSLFEELEITSCLSGRCGVLLNEIANSIDAEFIKSELYHKGTGKLVDIEEVHQRIGFNPKLIAER